MANSEDLGKLWRPFLHYMKKMELALTCPACSIVLRLPTLLPCTHIVCSQCITTKNDHEYECPVCMKTCSHGDLRSFMLMEHMTNIFKSLDGAMVSRVQKLGSSEFTTFGRKNCAHDAGKDTYISLGEPSVPPSLHDFRKPENNTDQSRGHGTAGVSKEGLPLGRTEAGIFEKTQNGWLLQCSKNSNDAKSHVLVSSSEEDDDVREARRRKLNSEHRSNCNNKPPGTSDHAYTTAAVECAFCHFSMTTEFTGPMLHYVNGKPAEPEVAQSNVKHFHDKCFKWVPEAFFDGDIANNMEGAIARASKIKCCECGQKGATLGCYVKSCEKSYHVPCAVELPGCRWDFVNFNLLCPSHCWFKFQHEIDELEVMDEAKHSSLLCDNSRTRQAETTKRLSAQIILGQLDCTPQEQYNGIWTAEPGVCNEWVLCGSDLSTSGMRLLDEFGSLTGATVTRRWKPNVTHIIASTNANGACSRTQKVLMAILNGRWVLTLEWVIASMAAGSPISEEPYEIGLDCYGISDGPKRGRIRAIQKAAQIFSGLDFYFCDQFEPHYRGFLEEVVLAAGGAVLKNADLVTEGLNANASSPGSSFIVYNEDPPQTCDLAVLKEMAEMRSDEVGAIHEKTGFKVLGHMRLLDYIAACSSDLEKDVP